MKLLLDSHVLIWAVEDPARLGVQAGRLEVELHAMELIEGEIAEVGPPGGDQVLLLRRQRQHRRLTQITNVAECAAETARRALQHCLRQRPCVGGAHEEPELARAFEFADCNGGIGMAVGREVASQMREVVEPIEQ